MTYVLSNVEVSHLSAWVKAEKTSDSTRKAVLGDLKGKTSDQVDAYLESARAWCDENITNKPTRDARKANLSRIVAGYRKANNMPGKRKAGGGRPRKGAPSAATIKLAEKMTHEEACDLAFQILEKRLPHVSEAARLAYGKRFAAIPAKV